MMKGGGTNDLGCDYHLCRCSRHVGDREMSVTNDELIRQLRTASIQADEMRLRDFGYLMKQAADEIERLKREVARNVLQKEWGGT